MQRGFHVWEYLVKLFFDCSPFSIFSCVDYFSTGNHCTHANLTKGNRWNLISIWVLREGKEKQMTLSSQNAFKVNKLFCHFFVLFPPYSASQEPDATSSVCVGSKSTNIFRFFFSRRYSRINKFLYNGICTSHVSCHTHRRRWSEVWC